MEKVDFKIAFKLLHTFNIKTLIYILKVDTGYCK